MDEFDLEGVEEALHRSVVVAAAGAAHRRYRLDVGELPSQLPSAKPLRRPLESTQYLALRYTERLAGAGIEPSVGSVGDSYDNALAETINGLFKAEVIHRRGP
jgi:transposase InsO family protein